MPDPDGEASAGTMIPLGKAGKICILFLAFFSRKTQRDFFSLYFGVGNLAVSGTHFRVSFIVPVLVANAGAGQSKLLIIPDSVLVSKSRYRSRLTYFISAIPVLR